MTVAELRRILGALPEDCDGLPVNLDVGGRLESAVMVDIIPPNNWRGEKPMIVLCDYPYVVNGAECPARTLPRHS